ncbi:Protein CBG17421 [Caenorhabditis briggsae]|uniref:Uncharacterized protein n=2 Tax=Caenorhabditis briggsae TaxID=6238 RepID=A0AAE9F895_CAEBR|nr:Protein CBG17421 [Caenorhabditis briggsae]ULT81009.1 hypothetical protein L3Y34_011105 [Caenorhabditis briggsae]UMM40302.1 hypothetical protein L5515_016983 [Caenorhabditis briggsae]CAP35082.1 Protein CBG17421 [Caenorhabditis briggsae]
MDDWLIRQFMDEFGLSEEHINRLYAIAARLAENPRLMQRLDDFDRRMNIMIFRDQQPVDPVVDENQENQENNDPNPVQELELEDGDVMEEFFRVQEEQIAQEEQQQAEENNNLPEDD